MSRILKIFFSSVLIIAVLVAVGAYILLNVSTTVTANLDSFIYSLPYKPGEKHKVVQGYGGLFSHRHAAALDFEMPVGTPVLASRGGVVYRYKDDSDEGGVFARYKKKANYIIIMHDDGSFGCYWHLKKHGVLVKNGRVVEGQQIGLSGATGQVFRPHLHFSIKRRFSYDEDAFVRTRFRTTGGIESLKKGHSYERP